MSYPPTNPVAKHRLFSPKLPTDNQTLLNNLQLGGSSNDAEEIFKCLRGSPREDLRNLADVYSYQDSPNPKLSRDLSIVGAINAHSDLASKINDEKCTAQVHSCTIAVKRLDGNHAQGLPEKDLANSKAFSFLMRKLKENSLVAVVGLDKYTRFSLLQPSSDLDCFSTKLQKADFVATCSIIQLSEAENLIDSSQSQEVVTGANHDLWQPPGSGESDGALWQPPDSTNESAEDFGTTFMSMMTKKRKREDTVEKANEPFHQDASAAAADRVYGENLTRTLESRYKSRIFHMRAFNNWVKATQISELDPSSKQGPMRVLDLACGKGGDLRKWCLHPRGIAKYVGSDVARGSLRDAAVRARAMRSELNNDCIFTCADLGADVPGRLRSSKQKHPQKLLTWSLMDDDGKVDVPVFKMIRGGGISLNESFDVISIQFAIHYMMSKRDRARRFFKTVGELLDTGGDLIITTTDARVILDHLMNLGLDLHDDGNVSDAAVIDVGGGACSITFAPESIKKIFKCFFSDGERATDSMYGLEYHFSLSDGENQEEGVGKAVNLPEWLTPVPLLTALASEAGLELQSYQNFHEFYATHSDPSVNDLAFSSLYKMKVLNQEGSISRAEWEISRLYCALRFRKVRPSTMNDEDTAGVSKDEEEDDIDDLDPAVKNKMMPLALITAKRKAGEKWSYLTESEKTRLTEVELLEMLKTSART